MLITFLSLVMALPPKSVIFTTVRDQRYVKCRIFKIIVRKLKKVFSNISESFSTESSFISVGKLHRCAGSFNRPVNFKRANTFCSLWPSTVIPLEIHAEIDNLQALAYANRIISATIQEFTKRTCIRFIRTVENISGENTIRLIIRKGNVCYPADQFGYSETSTLIWMDSCALIDGLDIFMQVFGIPSEDSLVLV